MKTTKIFLASDDLDDTLIRRIEQICEEQGIHVEIPCETTLLRAVSTIISKKINASSARLSRATALFESGDNAGACDALSFKEIEADAALNLENYRLGKTIREESEKAIRSIIEECRLKAKTVLKLIDNENRFDEAAKYYQQAISLASDGEVYPQIYVDLLDELADLYCEVDKNREAVALYNEIIWTLIENGHLHFEGSIDLYQNKIGLAYYALGDFNEALSWFFKALDHLETFDAGLFPNTVATYLNIGDVYNSLREYDTALEHFNKALKVQEEIPGREFPYPELIYQGIATAYEAKGDLDNAASNYLKSAQLGSDQARQWLLSNRPEHS